MWTEKQLEDRKLPPLRSKEEMKKILLDNEYGYLPDTEFEVTTGEPIIEDHRLALGTTSFGKVNMTFTSKFGSHTFPVYTLIHEDGEKHPFFVYISIHSVLPSIYFPVEEIADRGYDVFAFGYKDATSDNNDFTNGIAGVLFGPEGRKAPNDAGKLRLWALTASKVLDYALSQPSTDPARSAVMGHSRLGKTALLAGMLDDRFKYVCSNDSGCSGAALARGNTGTLGIQGEYGSHGERISDITRVFPYWFCTNYFRFAEENVPDIFDQHWLIAASAPRFVCVSSASFDDWADPVSEYVSCIAASPAWEEKGLPGFIHPDRMADKNEAFQEGSISYFKREGAHFLSRHDWNKYMDFMDKNGVGKF